ncbi:MAG: hypothetical protein F9K32_16640 [Desulfobulbaceae bacterium]|nr:MAG: hypothetical protein F9K32_16640 [Desulfobulbaceae bacterium]
MAKGRSIPLTPDDLTRDELLHLVKRVGFPVRQHDLVRARVEALWERASVIFARWNSEANQITRMRQELEAAREDMYRVDVVHPSYMKRRAVVARMNADVATAEQTAEASYRAYERLQRRAEELSELALNMSRRASSQKTGEVANV